MNSTIQFTSIKIQICGRMLRMFLNLVILKMQDHKIPFFSSTVQYWQTMFIYNKRLRNGLQEQRMDTFCKCIDCQSESYYVLPCQSPLKHLVRLSIFQHMCKLHCRFNNGCLADTLLGHLAFYLVR